MGQGCYGWKSVTWHLCSGLIGVVVAEVYNTREKAGRGVAEPGGREVISVY